MSAIDKIEFSHAQKLYDAIESGSADPIELKLYRNLNRMKGVALGLLTTGFFSGIFLYEAHTDRLKLIKIGKKLSKQSAVSGRAAQDIQTTIRSVNRFQKRVYKGIREYTETAMKIKMAIGISLAATQFGEWYKEYAADAHVDSRAGAWLTVLSLLITNCALVYGLYHRVLKREELTYANKLEAKKVRHLFSRQLVDV